VCGEDAIHRVNPWAANELIIIPSPPSATEFHPRLIGLTGTPEACAVAARAFRVYHHTTGETKDYLVDHSIITYLLGACQLFVLLAVATADGCFYGCADPAGDFVTFYGKNVTAEDMAAAVSDHVKRWDVSATKAV
jgi:protein SCO1/2